MSKLIDRLNQAFVSPAFDPARAADVAHETAPLLSSRRTCYTDKEKARAAVLAQFDAMSDDCVKAEVAELGTMHPCNEEIINAGRLEEGQEWYRRLMAKARRHPTPGGNWLDGDDSFYEQYGAL